MGKRRAAGICNWNPSELRGGFTCDRPVAGPGQSRCGPCETVWAARRQLALRQEKAQLDSDRARRWRNSDQIETLLGVGDPTADSRLILAGTAGPNSSKTAPTPPAPRAAGVSTAAATGAVAPPRAETSGRQQPLRSRVSTSGELSRKMLEQKWQLYDEYKAQTARYEQMAQQTRRHIGLLIADSQRLGVYSDDADEAVPVQTPRK